MTFPGSIAVTYSVENGKFFYMPLDRECSGGRGFNADFSLLFLKLRAGAGTGKLKKPAKPGPAICQPWQETKSRGDAEVARAGSRRD